VSEPTKYATINVPVWKQGDDFGHQLTLATGAGKPPVAALVGLAEQYEEAAAECRKAAALIGDTPVELSGDTHVITIAGPPALIERLVAEHLVTVDEYDDEEEEEGDWEAAYDNAPGVIDDDGAEPDLVVDETNPGE
jgi:hypothetical protein